MPRKSVWPDGRSHGLEKRVSTIGCQGRLVWWAAYWRERADQADAHMLAPRPGVLYDAA